MSDASDPTVEFRRCWSLDMLAPLDEIAEVAGGLLLSRWSDLAVEDLPPSAQTVALADSPSWRAIASALVEPEAVAYACDAFIDALRGQLAGGERAVGIALARAGLTSDRIPTLEELGGDWGLTRERIRQIVRFVDLEGRAQWALPWRAPLRLVLGAHFALRPQTPFVINDLANADTARGRTLKLAIETIGLPRASVPFLLWTETQVQRRAVEAVVDALPELLPRARSFPQLEALTAEALPQVDGALDLDATLVMLSERLDFGSALDGRFAFG